MRRRRQKRAMVEFIATIPELEIKRIVATRKQGKIIDGLLLPYLLERGYSIGRKVWMSPDDRSYTRLVWDILLPNKETLMSIEWAEDNEKQEK